MVEAGLTGRAQRGKSAQFIQGPAGKGAGLFGVIEDRSGFGYEAASAWVDALPDGPLKGGSVRNIANAFMDTHREEVRGWIEKYADTDYAIGAAGDFVVGLDDESIAEATEWANSLDEPGRSGALPNAIQKWAETDPAAASAFLSEVPPSESRDRAAWRLAMVIRRSEPEQAIAWAETIEIAPLREASLKGIARAYLFTDQQAAIEWLPNSGLDETAQGEMLKYLRENSR